MDCSFEHVLGGGCDYAAGPGLYLVSFEDLAHDLQVLVSSVGGGADENLVQMISPEFAGTTHFALVPRTPDLGLQSSQIDLVLFFVVGFWSGVDLEHRFPVCSFEIVLGYGVDFEDGEFAAALHRVVAYAST